MALDMLKPVCIYGIYLRRNIGDAIAALFRRLSRWRWWERSCWGSKARILLHFILFLFSFAIGYLINWILAALLGCAPLRH